MVFGQAKRKREVVVYSMGRDGSAAVHESLSVCPDVHVRQVYTLDRSKIANMNLREGQIPAHLRESDRILRRDLDGKIPHYFITMVHDPFARHIRQCFYLLQHQADEGSIGYALANPYAMQSHFESVPAQQTTHWFQEEYLPSTGIDVFATPFNYLSGHQEFKLGIHKLLILSAHLPADQQAGVISSFLDTKIPTVLPEKTPLDGMRDIFMAQILSSSRDQIINQFWYTRFTRHFFSADQIGIFQAQSEDISRQAMAMQETLEALKNATTRERLLQDALSPLMQVPQLVTELSVLAERRGPNTVLALTESLMKQMQRAQNNLLLSTLRAIGSDLPKPTAELGHRWIAPPTDERISKSLAATLQHASEITRPLALLKSLSHRDGPQQAQYRRLTAQQRLLDTPYAFTKPQERRYTPTPKTVLYNPHQSLPFHTSGYATRTHGLIKALRGRGYDVQAVTRIGYPADTQVGGVNFDGFAHDAVPYYFDHQLGRGQWDLPIDEYIDASANYLADHAKTLKPELIHTASNYICGMGGIEAARRLGIPSIYEMRGLWHITHWSKDESYAQTDKFALAQKLELECAAAADRVLAITGALKDWLIDHGIDGDKIYVAPNAVDLNQFQIRARDTDFAKLCGCDGKIVIGYIGSFVQYEGLDLLIAAVAMLPENLRVKIKLLWLGDGPVLPALLHQAAELGITDLIASLGRRPFDEVPRAYSIVDIAAFPRKGQAICEIVSPLKPFEAMAMGKAVLGSDVRPLKDIINHGKTGLLHEKDSAQSLSKALARLIEDENLRQNLGGNARAWVEETRSWDRIASDVVQVYEGLV